MTETYDFVVVGGGTAGLVTATRLSELADVSVLVIEAGSAKDDRLLEVPELWSQTNLSEFDWSYLTEPQPALGGETVY